MTAVLDEPSLPWRMSNAESRLAGLDAGFATQVHTIIKQDREQAVLKNTVEKHDAAITTLGDKLDKVYWALIGLSATIATSAAAIILAGGHP